MKLHETRHIERPLNEVFAFVADFANAAAWDPGVASSIATEDGPPEVGSNYELMVSFGSRKIPMTYEITKLEENARVVFEGHGGRLRAVDDIKFEKQGDGTLVDYTADLRFGGLMKLVTPLLAPALSRVGERALDGMVETLEQ